MKARFTLSCAVLLVCAVFALGGGEAFGYAGEKGSGSGPNPEYLSLPLSTHHTHLTRALAYCAGFPGLLDVRNPVNPLLTEEAALDAEKIGLYDELTDQGTITGKDPNTGQQMGPVWTNITPDGQWSYTRPSDAELKCDTNQKMVFPIVQPETPPPSTSPLYALYEALWNPKKGWFTNRFSPWAMQFHFATIDDFADDLATLRDFAYGTKTELVARSVYAFGGNTMWSADTCYSPPLKTTLKTGQMTPGSLRALGAYLHAVGDRYSHGVCRDHWDFTNGLWWYYHSPATENTRVAGCAFNAHSLEFGCPTTERAPFINNTVEGGIAVFKELRNYAAAHHFSARVANVDDHSKWLRRQLERYATLFQTNTNEKAGACRVSFTYALMKACAAAASTTPDMCLADVKVEDGGTCDSTALADCGTGTSTLPLTPSCPVTTPQATAAAP